MNGPLLREPYSKPLENGIFEFRTKQGSDITIVLYFFIIGKKAILTNGFIKKSQKTPKAEKELAKKSGVSRATISKIENGKTVEVKLSTIEAISNALDINWIKLIS